MHIAERFRRLSLWNKLGAVGALASICGLAVYFGQGNDATESTENSAQSSGEHSPAINARGNVEYSVSNQTRTEAPLVLSMTQENLGKHARHLRYGFDRPEYVSPLIVADLIQGLAEADETTVAVDIGASNESNKYSSEFEIRELPSGKWVWHTYKEDGVGIRGYPFFAYRYIATSPSGVSILETMESGGGSGTFCSVVLLAIQEDVALDTDNDRLKLAPRIILKSLGTISLGDRYGGEVEYRDGHLILGEDTSMMKHGGRTEAARIPIE